jgi:hypothetical protein
LAIAFAVQEESRDTLLSPTDTDLYSPVAPLAPCFPGCVETAYSTLQWRFYYKQSKGKSFIGFGSHAVVEEYALPLILLCLPCVGFTEMDAHAFPMQVTF